MKNLLFSLLLLCATPCLQAQTKAYLLGHSLVNFDMPAMVEGLSGAAGKAYDYDLQVGIGANLGWQWTNPYSAPGDILKRTAYSERQLVCPLNLSGTQDQQHGTEAEAHGTGAEAHGTGAEAHGTGAEAHGTGAEAHGTGAEAHGT